MNLNLVKKIISYLPKIIKYGPFFEIHFFGKRIRILNPKLKVSYCYLVENAGDLFNEDLLEFFHFDYVKILDPKYANLVLVGSVLDMVCSKDKSYSNVLNKKCIVCGSGFMYPNSSEPRYLVRDIEFLALRGKLSLSIAQQLLNKPLEIDVFADPGLLISLIYPLKRMPSYEIGIIPHYIDKDYLADIKIDFDRLGILLIDIQKAPKEVATDICQCKFILSSSLHGLIFADSYGVPNHQIVFLNKNNGYKTSVWGDNFKFMDYYSSYGILYEAPFIMEKLDFSNGSISSLTKKISSSYKIEHSEVEKKQKQLIRTINFARSKLMSRF